MTSRDTRPPKFRIYYMVPMVCYLARDDNMRHNSTDAMRLEPRAIRDLIVDELRNANACSFDGNWAGLPSAYDPGHLSSSGFRCSFGAVGVHCMHTMDSMDRFLPYPVHSMDTMDTMDACTHCGLFLRLSYTEEVAGRSHRMFLPVFPRTLRGTGSLVPPTKKPPCGGFSSRILDFRQC